MADMLEVSDLLPMVLKQRYHDGDRSAGHHEQYEA
jgi:hypothetical protein